MNEKTYLKQLMHALRVPHAMRRRVREDLRRELAAARQSGETMEAFIARVGTPQDVAEAMNDNYAEQMPTPRMRRVRVLLWSIFAVCVLGLVVLAGRDLWRLSLMREAVSVIGGADGPTAIFVTDATASAWRVFVPYVLPVVLGAVVLFVLRYLRRKQ